MIEVSPTPLMLVTNQTTAAPPKKRKGAKPGNFGTTKFVPTEEQKEQVVLLVGCGVTNRVIAKRLNIAESTLKLHFKEQLEFGREQAIAEVSSLVLAAALNGDRTSAFFYLKCRGGWKEGSTLELTGKDGNPVELRSKDVDLAKLPLEDKLALEAILMKAKQLEAPSDDS